MGCISISTRSLRSLFSIPKLMLICIIFHSSNSQDFPPTLSFEQGAAPDALVYSVCDFTSLGLVVSYGSWSDGIYTALRFNDSILCENFMSWSLITSLSSSNCIQLSVNPSRLNHGRAVVQAMICDGEAVCLPDLVSPAVEVTIRHSPFAVTFHVDMILDTATHPLPYNNLRSNRADWTPCLDSCRLPAVPSSRVTSEKFDCIILSSAKIIISKTR
jgi:hypothetical protein